MMRTGILIILLLCIQVGYAGVVINTTRVIFPGNQENTEIQLTNSGDMPSLVQSWVDEGGYQFLAGNQQCTLYGGTAGDADCRERRTTAENPCSEK
ncbi:fimbria/pilus periplasmic chaperone [Morganella morganii]|nr:fimbria/pilus periplasmic chaperone [Morganella morganii]